MESRQNLGSDGQLDPLDARDDVGRHPATDDPDLVAQGALQQLRIEPVGVDGRLGCNGKGAHQVEADNEGQPTKAHRVGERKPGAD